MAGRLSPMWVARVLCKLPVHLTTVSYITSHQTQKRTFSKMGPSKTMEISERYFMEGSKDVQDERRVEDLFVNPKVQFFLKKLSGQNLDKIFARRQLRRINTSEIKLLTDEQLTEARNAKLDEVTINLQMPPIMSTRKACEETLDEDSLLEHYDACQHAFIDITYGVKARNRYIVIRETNGVLRTATWEERDKMNQAFFPLQDRHLDLPAVFLEENLSAALDRGFHENLLDRACVQFEPDDPHFIRVCHAIYESINDARNFSVLESTRHMGGLIFYLVLQRKPDNYLIHLIQNGQLEDLADLLRLYYILHPADSVNFQSAMESDAGALDALKYYTSSESQSQGNLELAIQAYQENVRQMKTDKNLCQDLV